MGRSFSENRLHMLEEYIIAYSTRRKAGLDRPRLRWVAVVMEDKIRYRIIYLKKSNFMS